ncbi:hypothetical protein L580_0408 [Serratia fonticola AU-P3(3)]|nr:hypothetical protein L580_0408 [Serratia fonticola AU-P3(3)]
MAIALPLLIESQVLSQYYTVFPHVCIHHVAAPVRSPCFLPDFTVKFCAYRSAAFILWINMSSMAANLLGQ